MSIPVATIKDVDEYGPIIEWHQHWSELKGRDLFTHLAQPAQAVDVELIAECAEALRRPGSVKPDLNTIADKLTRALSGEKAGPVGDGWRPIETCPLHEFVMLLCPEHGMWAETGWKGRRSQTGFELATPYTQNAKQVWCPVDWGTPRGWMPLPASPTPDKEGA